MKIQFLLLVSLPALASAVPWYQDTTGLTRETRCDEHCASQNSANIGACCEWVGHQKFKQCKCIDVEGGQFPVGYCG